MAEEQLTSEDWSEIRNLGKAKRELNRNFAPGFLRDNGIDQFLVKNNGAHLIINLQGGRIDFWPGTGKWFAYIGNGSKVVKRHGIRNLVEFVKSNQKGDFSS